MIKKVVNFSVFILLATVIVWVLAKIRKTDEVFEDKYFIPRDAALVLKVNNINSFKNDFLNCDAWAQLSAIIPFSSLESDILKIDSIFAFNRQISGDYGNTKLYVSLHVIGKNKPDYLYRFVFPKSVNGKTFGQYLDQIYIDSRKTSRKYEGQEIHDIAGANETGFSYAVFKNQLLISSSAIVLENILRQDGKFSIEEENSTLTKLLNTAGKTVSANVIINQRELAKFFQSQSRNRGSFPLEFLQSFSGWSVLDLNFADNSVLATGFSNSSDSLSNYLSVFAGQEPSKVMFTSIAPANTKMFLSLNISDPNTFFNNYAKFLQKSNIENAIVGYQEKQESEYKIDLKTFYGLIDREISLIRTDFNLNEYSDNVFALVKVKSSSLAKEFFIDAVNKYCQAENLNPHNYQQTFSIDNSTRFNIVKLPSEKFLGSTFGSLFNEIKEPYIAFVDDYLVFANGRNTLEKLIHFKVLGKTLENDFDYGKVEEYYSSVSNIHYYQNIPNSLDLIGKSTNDKITSTIRDNVETFKKIPVLGFQYNNSSDLTFSSLFLNYFDKVNADAHTLWETLLDTSINFKPALVKNHYTSENEILVQDLRNNLYLINKVGRVLWKLKLNEQIMGDVHQVDFYNNGKLQLLFSTKSKIHLIDRNGNYVERYPVNLRAEATAPMALFDYDNDNNHRIFIPTNDKKVYAYDLEGNIINGWMFDRSERIVKNQVKHFRIDDKDYIVFSDGLRTYILNRKGEVRVPVNVIFQKSKNNNFVFEDKTALNDPRIAVTDTSGQVWFFTFDGAHQTKAFRKLSADHFFDFQDINADGYLDYIFLDRDELYVYDQRSEKELFSYKFKNPVDLPPIYFQFSFADRKIGVVDKTENKVYLINNDGNLYKGFPLQGNSLYSIGKLTSTSRFNLIVGNNNNFLLNYSVQ